MNADLGKRLARLEAAAQAELSADRPLSLAACNQLRVMIGEPRLTVAEHAGRASKPPLDQEARQALLAQLLEGLELAGRSAADASLV